MSEKSAVNIIYNNITKYLYEMIYGLSKSESRAVSAEPINNFLKKCQQDLYNEFCRVNNDIIRAMYFFYLFSQALYKCNEDLLQVSNRKFRARVYYPIVIYILVRYFPHLKQFIQTQINYVYNQLYRNSRKIITHFTYQYNVDQNIIKFDIFYIFLGNLIKKYNPLMVRNPSAFYRKIFETLYDYYLLRTQDYTTRLLDDAIVVEYLSNHGLQLRATEYAMYQEVLYSLEVEHMVATSPIIQQVYYNYDILRNIIVPHELQKMFINTTITNGEGTSYPEYNYYKFLKYDYEERNNDEVLKKLKSVPTIYRMLKSVHIYSKKSSVRIDKKLIETFVYEELLYLCKGLFHSDYVDVILKNIAQNFTDSIINGEYINLLTLSKVNINQITFPNQVKKFIRLCFTGTI